MTQVKTKKKITKKVAKKITKKAKKATLKDRKTLIIVESPTKIRSLSKFLGPKYEITSSKGHLIDLPKSTMGIDIENNFEPKYITIRGKGKTLAELKKAAKRCKAVLLATDPDREGEAISFHLARALKPACSEISRIVFNEITKDAVKDAIKHPRGIDMEMVNSQQARRLLDRLAGYSISPVLQDKFGSRRFSAGRVQSACLKILCSREDEIEKFTPREYFEVTTSWKTNASNKKDEEVLFSLAQINDRKADIPNRDKLNEIQNFTSSQKFELSKRKVSERNIKPQAPYITSKLQQEASTRLGFRVQKTMSVAQSLYEGVELSRGQVTGLITYMRTDSTRISTEGLNMVRDYVSERFPAEYLPEKAIEYKQKKVSQDAHEAIRPTNVELAPEKIASYLSRDQLKLYELIWAKFVASQMTSGIDALTTLEVLSTDDNSTSNVKSLMYRFSTSVQKFAGFRQVFKSKEGKKEYVPKFEEGDKLKLNEFNFEQKFTQPPPRYTEASLIKVMEESGIGRPATYVPTIGTLDKRGYMERKGRQLIPKTLGRVVNDIMVNHFTEIVNLEFTSIMEEKLDKIAEGNGDWRKMLEDFFGPLKKTIELAMENIEDKSHLIRIPTGRPCPKCEKELIKKLGKNGFFIGCSAFVDGCRYTESIPLGKCPECDGNVVSKKSKKGRTFYGCEKYSITGCEFVMLDKPASKTCVKCGSILGQKVKKSGITLTCQNKECGFVMQEDTEENQ